MPGETAFTRTPWLAYSMASDRVTALRPPLVSAASAAGTPARGWSATLVVMLTIWPAALTQHLRQSTLREVEEACEICRRQRREISFRIIDKWF